MKKQFKCYIICLGIILLVSGFLLKFLFPVSDEILRALTFVLIGSGTGIIGAGAAKIIRQRILDKNPQIAKQYEINENDERNILIREKAGYATWYLTLFMLAIISLIFIILDYKVASFILIGVLLIHCISLFVYSHIFSKKI